MKAAESYEYDLIGVTVHTGTADGGHYYSFIRDIVNPHAYRNNKWYVRVTLWAAEDCPLRPRGLTCHVPVRLRYLFNDAEVKPFDSAQLASECFGGEMTVRRERKRGGGALLALRLTQRDVKDVMGV